MSGKGFRRTRTVRGTIRSRLLVNAVVDPDEAAARLPIGLRPHITTDGTVVGCCLLDVDEIRPAALPARAGRRLRAAAHRISVEWDDDAGETVVGVYVPTRHTDSRLATLAGSRWFPGLHERARMELAEAGDQVAWSVVPVGDPAFALRVRAETSGTAEPPAASNPIAGACLGATIGLSPDRDGEIEAARMLPEHRRACEVTVVDLDSAFLAGFASARPATSYLMRDVAVSWSAVPTPRARAGAFA